ncbi:YraN family protein [Acinetobacter sp. ANC 4648]|uniref:YraN family protein n=1 Tax=Acinetobacter sp. ANC 4648 TaxID=1977875 RepID=UPI000A349450|nr:YraN family protein [Acinetobacter sp. ANC 4648]OTG81709.1 YraN family protein [Acinetobacter sp. ANC 4648]
MTLNQIKNHVKPLGQWAELEAVRMLKQAAYIIIHQNFHSRFGEIDILAIKGQELIFVEVKARSATQRGQAIEVVTSSKQLKIFKTALCFIEKNPEFHDFYYRFDVFCFDFHQVFAKNIQQDFSKYSYDSQWIENAFTLDADLINL